MITVLPSLKPVVHGKLAFHRSETVAVLLYLVNCSILCWNILILTCSSNSIRSDASSVPKLDDINFPSQYDRYRVYVRL